MTCQDKKLVEWIEEALEDLDTARHYARESSDPAAKVVVSGAIDSLQKLADQLDDRTPLELKPVFGNPIAVRT